MRWDWETTEAERAMEMGEWAQSKDLMESRLISPPVLSTLMAQPRQEDRYPTFFTSGA